MILIKSIAEMKQALLDRDPKSSLGFVPTMGALHRGHLSLVERSRRSCDLSIVSIYVNPAQFGPKEDLSKYPRDLEGDLALLEKQKVNYVFLPNDTMMYPDGYRTWVEVSGISDILCGASRPGHFCGVATIVLKLVHIIRPDMMFMGLKDYQQVVVLESMLRDLDLDSRIVRCPIVREDDGLALSSRNVYLTREERIAAISLYRSLQTAQEMAVSGTMESEIIIRTAEQTIVAAGGKPDYIKVVDDNSLAEQDTVAENSRMLMACFFGKTRLIDNAALLAAQ